jgi:zeaxanthin glucosyltransferase
VATIAFCAWPEPGHLLPIARLARKLRGRGHRVCFVWFPDAEEALAAHDADFVPIGASVFPKGTLAHPLQLLSSPLHRRKFLQLCSSPDPFDGFAPDLLVVDALVPILALAGVRRGLSVATFCTGFPYTRDGASPPLTSPLPFPRTQLDSLRVELAWGQRLARRALFRLQTRALRQPDVLGSLRALARSAGRPERSVETRCAVGYALDLPEIVTCPAALDFPNPGRPDRHFVEPLVDAGRREGDFPWKWIEPGKRLALCALGSQTDRYAARTLDRVLGGVIAAMASRPGWQTVIASGAHDPARLGAVPGNVRIVRDVPQIGLLRRAHLMIDHGGLNSVKEAIYFGVPQIVFPMVNDQPGNAARVAHHRVGVMADMRDLSAGAIDRLVREVEVDARIARRVREMSEVFTRAEEASPAVAVLERLLPGARSPARDEGAA